MIEIKINNEAEVLAQIDTLRNGVANLTPLMRGLAGRMEQAVGLNFAAGGRPAWAGSKYRSGRLLVSTGHLRDSIVSDYDANQAVVGTNVPYAPYLHYGTSPYTIRVKSKKALHWGGDGGPFAKEVKHPGLKPRPFLTLAPEDEQGMLTEVQDYFRSLGT